MTPGRYYFVPDSTPFFPGPHYLGSRDWDSDETGELGEWDGPQDKDNGAPPDILPLVKLVGSAECFSQGGGGTVTTVAHEGFDDWLPAGCYGPFERQHPAIRLRSCPDRAHIAECMANVFLDQAAAVVQAQQIVGPGSVATYFRPLNDLISGSVVCVRGDTAWQWADGTRNGGQLARQAFATVRGPTDFGGYDCTPIYHDYATALLSRFTAAGAAGCRRFVCVGHSYGGAASIVMAARLLIQDPTRDVVIQTYGAPRAGGSKLVRAATDAFWIEQTIRPKDPIPFLPPQLEWMHLGIVGPLAIPWMNAWGAYEHVTPLRMLTPEGIRAPLPNEVPTTGQITTIVNAIIFDGLWTDWEDHAMTAYANDFAALCGLDPPFGGLG